MHQVYLGLGTNLGDKEANLKAALEEIRKRVGEECSSDISKGKYIS